MNHLKQYIKLVRRAQARNSGVEEHHIFPRSIYGENDYKVYAYDERTLDCS